jgi:hypothetical protein
VDLPEAARQAVSLLPEAERNSRAVALREAAGHNSRAVVAENREAADNSRRQASSAVRTGQDGSPAGRHKAARMKTGRLP